MRRFIARLELAVYDPDQVAAAEWVLRTAAQRVRGGGTVVYRGGDVRPDGGYFLARFDADDAGLVRQALEIAQLVASDVREEAATDADREATT